MRLGVRVSAIFFALAGFLLTSPSAPAPAAPIEGARLAAARTQTARIGTARIGTARIGTARIEGVPVRGAQDCSLTRGGEVYCGDAAKPVRVPVTGRVVQLAAAGGSTCALTEPGEVYCWGGEDTAAAEPAGVGLSPLLLITLGLLLVGGGVTLVLVARPQGAASSAASRKWAAPSLSRSV